MSKAEDRALEAYPVHKVRVTIKKNLWKQAIQIGSNVTDMMKLPCVYSCHKEADGGLCFLLYDWNEYGRYVEARQGDWLCEDYDGRWHLLNDKEYKDGIEYREQCTGA